MHEEEIKDISKKKFTLVHLLKPQCTTRIWAPYMLWNQHQHTAVAFYCTYCLYSKISEVQQEKSASSLGTAQTGLSAAKFAVWGFIQGLLLQTGKKQQVVVEN